MKSTNFTDIATLIARCEKLGYPVDRSGRPNILFVEGLTPAFGQRARSIDNFCDAVVVYNFDGDSPKVLCGPYTCTVSAGLESMLNAPKKGLSGAALLDKGYHKDVWMEGFHKKLSDHPALVQVNPTRFVRDVNRNWVRDEVVHVGLRGQNIHRASKFQDARKVGRFSAGCLVIQNYKEFMKFLLVLKQWLTANPSAKKTWSATILAH